MKMRGFVVHEEQRKALESRYGLDQPIHIQYIKWITKFVKGDMGFSFGSNMPVRMLVTERVSRTILLSLASLIISFGIALPIGVYSATHKYTWQDYTVTFLSFLGMATPSFFLALLLMYIGSSLFGFSVGGLFSPQFLDAPWSFARFIDLLQHVWVPLAVLGVAGAAGSIRVMRANLLDELSRPYVTAARSRGLKEWQVIWKYPVRVAINPFLSTVGWLLPALISGEEIASIVLNLPTTGPLLLQSLITQDMYVAASIIMLLSILTVIGTLISDLVLAAVDPRIRIA